MAKAWRHRWSAGEADLRPPGGRKIARADVAHFIGTALTSASYIRESPTPRLLTRRNDGGA